MLSPPAYLLMLYASERLCSCMKFYLHQYEAQSRYRILLIGLSAEFNSFLVLICLLSCSPSKRKTQSNVAPKGCTEAVHEQLAIHLAVETDAETVTFIFVSRSLWTRELSLQTYLINL